MYQLAPTVSKKLSAQPFFRRCRWLVPVAMAVSELAVAGLPGEPAAGKLTAVSRTAAAGSASASAPAEEPRYGWQGSNYRDIAETWTRWLLSIPLGPDPLGSAETGINCGINQSGPVWFLAAPGGANYTRTCTVPAGKALAMPVMSYINDYPCPDPTFQPAPGLGVTEGTFTLTVK